MDLTVLHLAVPALTEDLRPGSAQLLWIIDIYGFMVAGCLVTMGTLGDRVGRRRMLLIGAAAFGIASVLAAMSRTAEALIATRALLGIAGATVAPSTLSLIRNMFLDDRQRTVAISVWMTAFSAGGVLGPFVGGALLEFFWWGSVFLIAVPVPVMVIVLVLGPFLLPEYRDPAAGKPDLPSAALSIAAVLAMIFGLKEIAQDGLAGMLLLAMFGGAALGVLFVRRQRVLADPMIDMRLFENPTFTASVASYGLTIFVLFGGFLFLPQYLQLVRGMSPLSAGVWGVPSSLAFVAGAIMTPYLGRTFPRATVMSIGLVVAAGGLAYFTRLHEATPMWGYLAASTLFALGSAPLFTMTNDLMIGGVPPERAGAAAGISETSAEFCGALAIAVFGSVGVAMYRSALTGVGLAAMPPDAMDAALATLGGAVVVAAELPSPSGAELLHAARQAFLLGIRTCAGIGAAGALALAVFVYARLRHVGKSVSA